MSKARDFLVDKLTVLEPAFRVLPYARTIDPPRKPTVLVRVDRVEPAGEAGARRVRRYRYAVIIIPIKTNGDPAEDELDACLEDVLAAIDAAPDVTWEAAERGTWEDTAFPAYEVTVSVPLKIGA